MRKYSSHSIRRSSILFLQAVIALIGIVTLVFMLLEPHLEGVNAHAKFFEAYLDPFVVLVYIGSIPFFTALYKSIKVLEYVKQNKTFSQVAVNALRTIKYCAFVTAGAIVAADVYLRVAAHSGDDDPAGAVMLGIIAAFASIVIGTAAAAFEKTLQ